MPSLWSRFLAWRFKDPQWKPTGYAYTFTGHDPQKADEVVVKAGRTSAQLAQNDKRAAERTAARAKAQKPTGRIVSIGRLR